MSGVEVAVSAATMISGVMSVKPLLWDPLKGAFRSTGGMKKKYTVCKESMKKLLDKKDGYENCLASCMSTQRPSIAYNNWIQEVEKLAKQWEEIKKKYEIKMKNSKFLPSLTCIKLYGKMSKLIDEADCLECKEMRDISTRKEPDCVIEMKEAPDIGNFPTLCKPLAKILNLSSNKKIKCIEICGTMGAGKTTIMQNLNNHKKVASMFDIVIWVNVSTKEDERNFSIREMQKTILRRLNLDHEEDAKDEEVAEKIRGDLKEKKCLLLFDGVKEELKLTEIGIDLNLGIGSKVVFTTNNCHVSHLIVDRQVTVGTLSLEEAMNMFKKILGQSKGNYIGPYMPMVVKRCGNLPFVIKIVASAFRKRETEESWAKGHTNLIKFPNEGDAAIQKVYNFIKFCCNDLEGAEKDCFLYCALYPEEMKICADRLLDCWGAEDLYPKERGRGRHILDELKKISLLEERWYEHKEYVLMHGLMRKVAVDKLLDDSKCRHLVKAGESLKKQPRSKEWNEKYRISLVGNLITALSQCPNCPLLSTLLLEDNQNLREIHNYFFENTKNLRVLNLCCTGIMSLPSSLWKLSLLKVLYLRDSTSLRKIPSEIGELGSLEVLDLRGIGDDENIPSQHEGIIGAVHNFMFRRSKIGRCPPLTNIENLILTGIIGAVHNFMFRRSKIGRYPPLTNIEKLRNLKRLLVSFNIFGNENDTTYILDYCNVISKVSNLEELVIDVKSYKQRCSEMISMVRDKIMTTMTNLNTLKFCFKDGVEDVIKVVVGTPRTYHHGTQDLTNFVRNLDDSASKSFQLFIGRPISSPPQIPYRDEYQRYLIYDEGSGSNSTNISKVLAVTDAFELVNHRDLTNVSEFGTESLHGIRSCLIEGCSNITGIADGNCTGDPLLPNVEHLYIKYLSKLGSIWKDTVHALSLSRLTTLQVDDCCSMEELLIEPASNSILPIRKLVLVNLRNLTTICKKESPEWPLLEEVKIQNCPKLIEFPFSQDNTCKLKKLILDDMPNLKLICAYELLEWPDLEKLKIYGCPILTELPFNRDNAMNLKYIKADIKWWEALQWKDPNVKERLKPYCYMQEDRSANIGNAGP